LSLPLAVPLRTWVAAARRPDEGVRAWSLQRPGEVLQAGEGDLVPGGVNGWGAYVAGVVWAMRDAGYPVGGMELVVDGRVPAGSGLSSSAALECAVALAGRDLFCPEAPLDGPALARLARRAENDFVGVPCGLMDQMVAMTAVAGHALLFDAGDESTRPVPFQPGVGGLALLVIDTHAAHDHGSGAYSERRRQCDQAARLLGLADLGRLTVAELPAALSLLASHPHLVPRVRHVVTENDRTRRAAALLDAGRLGDLGPLLTESHRSLRHDFAVSSPELDAAVDAAVAAGALGARLTGGGFGGCALALCPAESAATMVAAVEAAAREGGHPRPGVWPAEASSAAGGGLLGAGTEGRSRR
jgi:galactokinase